MDFSKIKAKPHSLSRIEKSFLWIPAETHAFCHLSVHVVPMEVCEGPLGSLCHQVT